MVAVVTGDGVAVVTVVIGDGVVVLSVVIGDGVAVVTLASVGRPHTMDIGQTETSGVTGGQIYKYQINSEQTMAYDHRRTGQFFVGGGLHHLFQFFVGGLSQLSR